MAVYEKLAKAITDVVHRQDGATWQERRQRVEDACDEDNLNEFLAWFDCPEGAIPPNSH